MSDVLEGLRVHRPTASPSKAEVYQAACRYVAAGLSLIPIRADGTKMPAFGLLPKVWCPYEREHHTVWRCYKDRRPTGAELDAWFRNTVGDYGFAVLGGAVSGGLEIIDCDNWAAAGRWADLVEAAAPGLLGRLVLVQSPRPGLHAYYRCPMIAGNRKVARVPDPEHGGKKAKTIIEVKGEAGYCLAPPSPAACHKTRRCYTILGLKDLADVPVVSPDERAVLLDCAARLDCWEAATEPHRTPRRPVGPAATTRPGDDFNRRAVWGDVLGPHGWKKTGRGMRGEETWVRPGKGAGVSATTNYAGSDLLYVFSTNAPPFEDLTGYTKFHAFALLEHGGDFHLAAKRLAAIGYGKSRPAAQAGDPFARYAGYKSRTARNRTRQR